MEKKFTPKQFDDALREHYSKIVASTPAEKLKGSLFVGSPIDYFGDGVWVPCEACQAVLISVRPWVKEIVDKYAMKVICPSCAILFDEPGLTGKIVQDSTIIEQYVEEHKNGK